MALIHALVRQGLTSVRFVKNCLLLALPQKTDTRRLKCDSLIYLYHFNYFNEKIFSFIPVGLVDSLLVLCTTIAK